MVEGFCYHRLKNSENYINEFIRYTVNVKNVTKLKYLGYRRLLPQEEIRRVFGSSTATRRFFDIAENYVYPIEILFQYGNEPEPRSYIIYLPYLRKGNIMKLNDTNFLISPVLADKVISIGDNIVFINIVTAKYNFERAVHSIVHDGRYEQVSIIHTKLYNKKDDEKTSNALHTIMNYLLAIKGYEATAMEILGYVPKVVYSVTEEEMKEYSVLESVKLPPRRFMSDGGVYKPNHMKFLIKKNDEKSTFFIGNILYLIDHFPTYVNAGDINDVFVWRRILGEIIHSNNKSFKYIKSRQDAHFKDITSAFDGITARKLQDVGYPASNLLELMVHIFNNFNKWLLAEEKHHLIDNKTYECELFALLNITSQINKAVLDIAKEEIKLEDPEAQLDEKQVDKALDRIKARSIFNIKKEKLIASSAMSTGDHLYPKLTSLVVEQKSNPTNVKKSKAGKSNLRELKIEPSMAVVGNILGLPKKNPTPVVRLNPYVQVDNATGSILLTEEIHHILEDTKHAMKTYKNEYLEEYFESSIEADDMDFDEYDEEDFESYDMTDED